MHSVGQSRTPAQSSSKVKAEPTPLPYTLESHFDHKHPHVTTQSPQFASSASERAAPPRNRRHNHSAKMTITNTTSNKRMAIQTLLNDSSRDLPRSSSGRSSTRAFKCDQCHKTFTQSADVRKHKKTVHEGARDYHCEECSLSFGERGNLNKHIRSIHRKERNFVCEQCNASFPFKNGLKEHIRMKHTDERPYECNNCSSSFKKKSHLQRHIAVVHKG